MSGWPTNPVQVRAIGAMTDEEFALSLQEAETEHGPVISFPPLAEEVLAGQVVGEDMLDLAADLASATGRPVDVFLGYAGVEVDGVRRLSVCLRVDR